MYKGMHDANDPGIPVEERKFKQPPQQPSQPPTLIDLKVYQDKQLKPQQPPYNYTGYIPPYMPTLQQQQQILKGVPTVTNYNINIGPTDVQTALIFEGQLPEIETSGITVNDRLGMFQYLRSILFSRGNGEDIDITSYGQNNLLSHIKLIEINPYNYNKISNNPYKGLPDGFLIYRSCYPIRYNKASVSTTCSKNSTGANIRIYKMLEGSYLSAKHKSGTNYNDYDELREVAYYEYIREKILKQYRSPNFILMYGYYITDKTTIDFDVISRVKQGPKPYQQFPIMQPQFAQYPYKNPLITKPVEIDINSYTGKNIVMLTESPTYNIIRWASITYEDNGTIKKVISTGYHTDKVWYSIIFQIMVALYVLQKSKICINGMSLGRNIFIKELTLHSNVTNCWKYRIDGVEYYIPNYGYLVLVDSHFKPYDSTEIYSHTLQGEIYSDPDEVDTKNIMLEQLKRILNPNNFRGDFISSGGCALPDNVLRLLEKIYTDVKDDKMIEEYIFKYFGMFMNNRIGSYLKEVEIPNIRKMEIKEFIKGELVVYELYANTYKFGLFVKYKEGGGGDCIILLDNYELKEINIGDLYKYADIQVEQDFKANEMNLSDVNETYII